MPDHGARRLERFTLELSAYMSISDAKDDPSVVELKTADVSSGGAFFETGQPLPVGTEVKIDLLLPLDELKKLEGRKAKIAVSGAVVRTDNSGMAVCFDEKYQISRIRS